LIGLGSASTICAPSSPVAAPGGIVDIVARLIDQWLSQRLGQQFVIENRTSASGNIATEFVANLVSSSSNTTEKWGKVIRTAGLTAE